MAGIVSGIGFSFQVESVGGTWRWIVVSNHIPGYGSLYQVKDIITPYGILQQTLIPIPDTVIDAISDSINSIKQQFAPQMIILNPSPLILVGSATEGDALKELGEINVQNNGAYGSFMNVTAIASAPWLVIDPTYINDLSKGESGKFKIYANPANLDSGISPYLATITIQDNRVPATVSTASIVFTVNPRPVITVDALSLSFNYYRNTQTSTSALQLAVSNSGPINSILEASIAKAQNQAWWTFSPASVGPLSSGSNQTVAVSILNQNVPLNQGTYTDKLLVSSNNASNGPVEVSISLTVI